MGSTKNVDLKLPYLIFPLLAVCWPIALQANVPQASELYIGTATTDITPALPAAVDGQMTLRIAMEAETPLTANVLVLNAGSGNDPGNASILVSCDLVTIPNELRDLIRESVGERLPGIDTKKIIISATHTHTAGVVREGLYNIPEGVTQVNAFLTQITAQVTDAIAKAWESRQAGTISWGLGYAKVAYNRRATYEDGSARMYGSTQIPEFRQIEGYEDQSIHSLFFWNKAGKLIAIGINVASPAQIVESRSSINADYWHPVRQSLQAKFDKDLVVLGWIGAAGDQTPRPMFDNLAENRMLELRAGNNKEDFLNKEPAFRTDVYLDEVARRIVTSVMDTYETVKENRYENPVLNHAVEDLDLPMRMVTAEENAESKKLQEDIMNDPEMAAKYQRRIGWYGEVLKRYTNQKTHPQPIYPVEVHILRLGDVVLCTNPFELFTDFGVQIKSRSKALQTFVVQLVGPGTYLPTKEAVQGGHYSAVVQSNLVGPSGGQLLVDRTVEWINALFE